MDLSATDALALIEERVSESLGCKTLESLREVDRRFEERLSEEAFVRAAEAFPDRVRALMEKFAPHQMKIEMEANIKRMKKGEPP